MANKRDFKKAVEAVGASICEEMMTAYYNVKNADKNAIASAIQSVLSAIENAKDNANVNFDKGVKAFESKEQYSKEKKAFFKSLFDKIHAEYAEQLDQAVNAFNKAIPQKVKDQNKEAAN